jgi:osmotically-inducible protein OsmY
MRRWIVLWAVLSLAGCEERELAALRKVGQRVVDKTEGLVQEAAERLAARAPEPAAVDTPDLAQRVRGRLQWDRKLAGQTITVQVQGDEVRLSGAIKDESLRQRAVELAESTLGVAKVTTTWTDLRDDPPD